MITVLALAHGHSHGYASYLIFRWLWQQFHWWSIPIGIGGSIAVGFLKAALGIGDDDDS